MPASIAEPARRWLLDVGPAAAVLGLVWAKLVFLSVTLDAQPFPIERHALSATLACLLIAFAPLAWLPRPWRLGTALALDLAFTSLALADSVHFRFFGDVISMSDLSRGAQLKGVVSSVVDALRRSDALLFLDVVLGLALLPAYARASRRLPAQPRAARARLALGVLAGGLLAGLPAGWMAWRDEEEVFEYANARRQVVAAVGLLPYHVFDVASHVAYPFRGRMTLSEPERRRVAAFMREWRAGAGPRSELYGAARGRNLIVVMAESLHDFPIGLRVGGQEVAPNLAALARESLRFTSFLDQTHLGATADGEFTSLQGLHPLPAGAVATRYPANDYHGLPAILADHGYRTLSIVGQPGDYWNMRQMHARLGFQGSHFHDGFLSDRDAFRRALPILESETRPFMAFLITLTNHHPYRLAAAVERELELGALEGTLVGDYLHSVHSFDRALGEFVAGLRASGLLEQSVLAVYGDHQAWLQEPPELARLLGFAPGSELDHWLVTKKLPFLVRLPGAEAAGERRVTGGHLDVAPTLLGLLGVTDPAAVMLGRDLTRGHDSLVVFRDGSFTDGAHHFLNAFGPLSAAHAYAAATGRRLDPARLERQRRVARQRLAVSDRIIQANLIPALAARAAAEPPARAAPILAEGFQVVGHRGAPLVAPENTLAGIAAAFAAGAQMVEVDVQLTQDGVPVLMHDETLERTTDGTGPVAARTLGQIKALDAGAWMGPAHAGARVPTLAEALAAARGRGRLLLDPKVEGLGRPVAEVLRRLGLAPRDVVLGTWGDAYVRDFAAHLPGAEILWSGAPPPAWDADFFREQRARGVAGFEIGERLSREFVAAAHAHGMPVYMYVVNDTTALRYFVEIGMDAIETDEPAVLRDLVARLRAAPGAKP